MRRTSSLSERKQFMRRILQVFSLVLALVSAAYATVFGSLRGIVHDPQHRPIAAAEVVLKAKNSDYTQKTETDAQGQFHFDAVPLGEYGVTASNPDFTTAEQSVTVLSGTAPILHIPLSLLTQTQTVTVSADAAPGQVESITPTTLVDRTQIEETPGAARKNSLAMITDYMPGAYMTHDQLHVRGGHQVSWLIDGVPIPNTNIASNLGPQIDPKDIDELEVQRGSYAADLGDRTYGVFDAAPHTTFDLSLGRDFGERFSVNVQAVNVANRRVLLDNSFTFGGTHDLNPREIFVQLRFRFHY